MKSCSVIHSNHPGQQVHFKPYFRLMGIFWLRVRSQACGYYNFIHVNDEVLDKVLRVIEAYTATRSIDSELEATTAFVKMTSEEKLAFLDSFEELFQPFYEMLHSKINLMCDICTQERWEKMACMDNLQRGNHIMILRNIINHFHGHLHPIIWNSSSLVISHLYT